MPKSLRNHSHLIDRRLRFRLRIYFLISLLFLGIFLFNVVRGALRLDLGLIALFVGIILGIAFSRMFHTRWDKNVGKVIGRLDLYGIGILGIYIFFEIMRDKIVAYFTHDIQVGTVSFAVLAGIMFGRFIGTRGKIIKILLEEKVFKA